MTIVSRSDHEAALAGLANTVRDPRDGILGPRSLAWRLGGDLGVLLGGGRAALLQLAHPMVAYAIDQHSRTRTDIVGRFQRTFGHLFSIVFGELDDALSAARRVHAIHAGIHGTIPLAVGAWPAGTRYHANDVDALRWVHATLVDTVIVVRERLEGPLPVEIKNAFVLEHHRVAALFGIPADVMPTSWHAHAAYMQHMLASDQIAVAPCARDMARFLVGRGGPGPQPPLGRILEAVTATLLPDRLIDGFGLMTSRASATATRLALGAFGLLYRRLPYALVGMPARTAATRRLEGKAAPPFSAWAERQVFALARRVTPPAPR